MTDQLDCVVVGAGVVGLAVARSFALVGREVIVLESESQIGMHTSSRNSEVIHAGIYYPQGSLKAKFCVQGKEMLYRYCAEHRVDHRRIGKLIVGSSADDEEKLAAIEKHAGSNGVDDLRRLSSREIAQLEPNVACGSGLFSPSTGIIDSHGLMVAMRAELESLGGAVVFNSRVENLRAIDGRIRFAIAGDDFECETLVNSAGLWAQELVSPLFGESGTQLPQIHFAKGHYFSYAGRSPFSHLVYPLPRDGGLGIHATIDLSGAVRFGPDVAWIEAIDYSFDECRKENFAAAIRNYYPDIDEQKLVPGYTGIRPKLSGPGDAPADFMIQVESDHGVPGLVNLFGIESPGLTASLAIGDYVAENVL